jgi:hypothetical protein
MYEYKGKMPKGKKKHRSERINDVFSRSFVSFVRLAFNKMIDVYKATNILWRKLVFQ